MGDICCSVAILKNKISSLWRLCPDPGQSQEDPCSPDLVYSLACQPRFADLCGVNHGACTCGPGFGERVTKLGLTALSFWREMVSGSE